MRIPNPVLRVDGMWLTYDRFLCFDCAGTSARHTGITHDGHRLVPVRAADVTEWATYGLGPLTCDCGRKRAVLNARGALAIETAA